MLKAIFEPQELSEIMRCHYHLLAEMAANRHLIIDPESPRGNVCMTVPNNVFFDLLSDMADMTIKPYEGNMFLATAKQHDWHELRLELTITEANALWGVLSHNWSDLSCYFLDNKWQWISRHDNSGVTLIVRGANSRALQNIAGKIVELLPELTGWTMKL